MKICPHCETEIPEDAERCPGCDAPALQGIVEAAAVMTGSGALGLGTKSNMAGLVEKAMSKAILEANAEGIGHDQPDVIRERMLEARKAMVDYLRLYESELSAAISAVDEERVLELTSKHREIIESL